MLKRDNPVRKLLELDGDLEHCLFSTIFEMMIQSDSFFEGVGIPPISNMWLAGKSPLPCLILLGGSTKK